MIAKVITDVSLDREFDYEVPDEMAGSIAVGSAVEAPVQRHVGYDPRDHRFAFFAPAGLRSGLR